MVREIPMRALVALLVLGSTLLGACGSGPANVRPDDAERLAPATLYPLALGHVWSYDIDTQTGSHTLSVTRVVNVIGDRVEVSSNGGDPIVYERRAEGLYRSATETWLLHAPIRDGSEWPAPNGATARVTDADETIEVNAGRFEGCVRVEETGSENDRTVITVYCPEVGPVYVESSMELTTSAVPVRVVGRLLGYAFEATE
jgi:hypothetical protein